MEFSLKEKLEPLSVAEVKRKLQISLATGVLGLFGMTIFATLSMVFLNGFGITNIPKEIVVALIGATIAETGGMLILILQSVFENVSPGE